MYVFFCTIEHNLILQEKLLHMRNLPFLPNPRVTTLEIGNVCDNMGALNLPSFFEGRLNLSIHTYNVKLSDFYNRFQ
jgi:hypothetical protein